MYEISFRQPLLMQYPGHIKAGSTIDALTQNLDFAETFLDYANAPIPEDFQGKSLRPLLENKVNGVDFRNALYYHYYDFPAFHMVKKHYGVKTARYAMMHFYDDIDQWELYDVENDPEEHHNIYNDPNYADVQKRLHKTLDSLQVVYKDTADFEKATKEEVDRAYRSFSTLRGKEKDYYPNPNTDQ